MTEETIGADGKSDFYLIPNTADSCFSKADYVYRRQVIDLSTQTWVRSTIVFLVPGKLLANPRFLCFRLGKGACCHESTWSPCLSGHRLDRPLKGRPVLRKIS